MRWMQSYGNATESQDLELRGPLPIVELQCFAEHPLLFLGVILLDLLLRAIGGAILQALHLVLLLHQGRVNAQLQATAVDTLCVVLRRSALNLMTLQGSDGDARASIIRRAGDLCERIATLQVYRVLLPSHTSIGKLLGHNGGPLLGLEDNIKATVRCLLFVVLISPLDILGDLHNHFGIQDARV